MTNTVTEEEAKEKWWVGRRVWTGLRDIKGEKIHTGDRIRFLRNHENDAIWDGDVLFEDGVFTVDILTPSQVENPKKWDRQHDWIKSRWWGTSVGYGEYGSWNCPRKPLTEIHSGFKEYEDLRELYDQFGNLDGRIINVEIIGEAIPNRGIS